MQGREWCPFPARLGMIHRELSGVHRALGSGHGTSLLQSWGASCLRLSTSQDSPKISQPKRIKLFPNKCILELSARIFIGIQKYLTTNKVKLIMSSIQSKITKYAKKQKTMTYKKLWPHACQQRPSRKNLNFYLHLAAVRNPITSRQGWCPP